MSKFYVETDKMRICSDDQKRIAIKIKALQHILKEASNHHLFGDRGGALKARLVKTLTF